MSENVFINFENEFGKYWLGMPRLITKRGKTLKLLDWIPHNKEMTQDNTETLDNPYLLSSIIHWKINLRILRGNVPANY